MGLIVTVYRNAGGYDCTMNGASKRYDKFTVINAEGPFEPTDEAPAAILKPYVGTVHLRPVECGEKWTMMGGNYAACSDSRFSQAVEKLLGHKFYGAVPIHDRIEG